MDMPCPSCENITLRQTRTDDTPVRKTIQTLDGTMMSTDEALHDDYSNNNVENAHSSTLNKHQEPNQMNTLQTKN